jgi:2-polyprenyl-3-methyl-5-hydroxy-6-metoxy-1,4-benzoquinol methylase
LVNAAGAEDLKAFFQAKSARKLLDGGRIVSTKVLDKAEVSALNAEAAFARARERVSPELVLEHERIPFPSYPYEWPPEMLHTAGDLTLQLALDLLEDGVGLKDGTPYNVLFRGPEPVFIDVLSFERRDAGDPTWLPYAQFVRTFLLPLLANRYFGLSLESILSVRRDGLEPEEVYRWLRVGQKVRPPFLSLVSLPVWLSGKKSDSVYRKRSLENAEKAQFILETLLKGLRRKLNRLRPVPGRGSTWSDYMTANNNYSGEHFEAKQAFVEQALREFKPRRVLDVGCNTGHFSAAAARTGARVVAIDYDPVVVGETWRTARKEGLDILPLVVNLTRPTPGIGWRNEECSSFWERAKGGFDSVLMLAVMHHMLVTERIPLEEIVSAAAELTNGVLIIEFVGPQDSMFQRLVRGRDHLHKDLTSHAFESVCRRYFDIVRSQHLQETHRWLYLLRRRI